MADTGKAQARANREQRLAAALRENLKRRKAQARDRRGDDGPGPSSAEDAQTVPESHDSAGFVPKNDAR